MRLRECVRERASEERDEKTRKQKRLKLHTAQGTGALHCIWGEHHL